MFVEIGALVQKDFGPKVLEALNDTSGVKSISVETGRSSDLFDEKQFGEFGEAAIVTILADINSKDLIFNKVYEVCKLQTERQGLVFMSPDVLKTSVSWIWDFVLFPIILEFRLIYLIMLFVVFFSATNPI